MTKQLFLTAASLAIGLAGFSIEAQAETMRRHVVRGRSGTHLMIHYVRKSPHALIGVQKTKIRRYAAMKGGRNQ